MQPQDEAKVQHCLALLEEAQGLINQAASALCSVPGFADEWAGLSEPYDCVKSHWYKIEHQRRLARAQGQPACP